MTRDQAINLYLDERLVRKHIGAAPLHTRANVRRQAREFVAEERAKLDQSIAAFRAALREFSERAGVVEMRLLELPDPEVDALLAAESPPAEITNHQAWLQRITRYGSRPSGSRPSAIKRTGS